MTNIQWSTLYHNQGSKNACNLPFWFVFQGFVTLYWKICRISHHYLWHMGWFMNCDFKWGSGGLPLIMLFYTKDFKGATQKVNIFMNVQTVYFFKSPYPPLQMYRPTFLVSKIWVSRIKVIVQQQKLTLLSSLFDMYQMITLAMYYDLQISVNIVYFQI